MFVDYCSDSESVRFGTAPAPVIKYLPTPVTEIKKGRLRLLLKPYPRQTERHCGL